MFTIHYKGFAILTRLGNHNCVNATSARKNVQFYWSLKYNKLYWPKQFYGTITTSTLGHYDFGKEFY